MSVRQAHCAATASPRCELIMEPLAHSNFYFGLRTGAKLELPATDLTARERVDLVASIARALGLPDVDRHIRDQWWWAS